MSETKFTPGPWDFLTPRHGYPYIVSKAGTHVAKTDCSISSNNWAKDHEEAKANARLIASAPELLEALESIQKILAQSVPIDYKRDCFESLQLANAAISKAKGQP